jgi:hypothetical protein
MLSAQSIAEQGDGHLSENGWRIRAAPLPPLGVRTKRSVRVIRFEQHPYTEVLSRQVTRAIARRPLDQLDRLSRLAPPQTGLHLLVEGKLAGAGGNQETRHEPRH